MTAYDPSKRDPRFAGASLSCLWELAALAAHYHPSVRKFAEHIMLDPKSAMSYDGDPLMDFTVSALARLLSLLVAVLARIEGEMARVLPWGLPVRLLF